MFKLGTIASSQQPALVDLGINPGEMINLDPSDLINTSFSDGGTIIGADITGGYINCGTDVSLKATNKVSYVGWYKFDSRAANNYLARDMGWPDNERWRLNISGGASDELEIMVSTDGTGAASKIKLYRTTTVNLVNGTWYMITWTFDTNVLKIYVNDTEYSTSKVFNGTFNTIHGGAGNPFLIGNSTSGDVVNNSWWDGEVLTQADITNLYNSGSGLDPADLVPSGSQRLVSNWLWNTTQNNYPYIEDNVKA